ncbi:hypothetical protein C8J56DRAFT_318423 [Mycena floridula]|nr:hypothetical protein C8J56DRAFT_318423 [Mycena floridula]
MSLIYGPQDCRAVDELVQNTFRGTDSPSALMYFVGDKPTWKSPTNIFRGEPWKVESVPTIIKMRDGKELARLDDEVTFGKDLPAFVRGD